MRIFHDQGGDKTLVLYADTPEKAIEKLIAEDWEGIYDNFGEFKLVEVEMVALHRIKMEYGQAALVETISPETYGRSDTWV